MPQFLIGLTVSFVALFALFAVLERLFPGIPGQRRFRRGMRTDVTYWFIYSPIGRVLGVVAGVAALLLVAPAFGVSIDGASLRSWVHRETFITAQPAWLQVLELLLIADLTGYWAHRAFHVEKHLWSYHAIHHSSMDLDWLSAVRQHPVNDAAMTFVQALPLIILGFEPGALAPFAVFLVLYAIFVHANLSWNFGWFRYVVASPVFHRWHHTSELEGLNKNFAGLFPVFDMLFGTFYMPKDRQPRMFGVVGEEIPQGMLRQLIYPFRKPGSAAIA